MSGKFKVEDLINLPKTKGIRKKFFVQLRVLEPLWQ